MKESCFVPPCVMTLVLLTALPVCAQPAADLHMFRGPPRHTGVAARDEQLSVPLEPAWKFETVNVGIHSASKSSPVADEARVYVGADNERFYALDKRTGTLIWQWSTRPCRNGIHGSPAVDASCVYIGDYGGWLTALDKLTGRLVWEVQLGDSIGASPVIVEDRVYVAVEVRTPDGYLAAVDRRSGQPLHKRVFRLGDHSHATPTIDPSSGSVYLGGNRGFFHCLQADTGEELWRFAAQGALKQLPADGERPQLRGQIKCTAALTGHYVLFTSWDKRLHCLDTRSGTENWHFETDAPSMSSPAVDEETSRVYFGSHDCNVYAVDLEDGSEIWRFKTGQRIIASPVVVRSAEEAGKLVVVGSMDGYLYFLDDASGRLVWRVPAGSPISNVVCISDGRLYLSTNGGQLLCWKSAAAR